MASHHRLVVDPGPRRWPAWLSSAVGLAALTLSAVWGAAALDRPVPDGIQLTGAVAAPTTATTAAPTSAAAPPTAPPVEVAPPTARIHYGPLVEDCTLSDPLTPIYFCPGG